MELEPPANMFFVQFAEPKTQLGAEVRKAMMTRGFPNNVGKRLSAALKIRRVRVAVIHCERPNAHYDPRRRRIEICYELVPAINDNLDKPRKGDPTLYPETEAMLRFAVLHEFAHMLMHEIGFRDSEDRADQFAILFLTESDDSSITIETIRPVVAFFDRQARLGQGRTRPGDPHSSNFDRGAEAACLWAGRSDASDLDIDPQVHSICQKRAAHFAKVWNQALVSNARKSPLFRAGTKR